VKFEFRTAGHNIYDVLYFNPCPSKCGKIEDGVSFSDSSGSGWWVLDYKDLMVMAAIAKAIREKD
jgi:hypothetical protein